MPKNADSPIRGQDYLEDCFRNRVDSWHNIALRRKRSADYLTEYSNFFGGFLEKFLFFLEVPLFVPILFLSAEYNQFLESIFQLREKQ